MTNNKINILSKAQQSGEPATALDQKRISTKNQDTFVAILIKT